MSRTRYNVKWDRISGTSDHTARCQSLPGVTLGTITFNKVDRRWHFALQSPLIPPGISVAVLDIMDIMQEYRHNEAGRKRHQSKFTVFYKKPLSAEDESAFADEDPPKFQAVPAGGAVEVPEGYDVTFPEQPVPTAISNPSIASISAKSRSASVCASNRSRWTSRTPTIACIAL